MFSKSLLFLLFTHHTMNPLEMFCYVPLVTYTYIQAEIPHKLCVVLESLCALLEHIIVHMQENYTESTTVGELLLISVGRTLHITT